jgi:hypothetical protein
MPLQKFASEIFASVPLTPYAALQNKIHLFVRAAVKPATDQQVQVNSRWPAREHRVGQTREPE